MKAPERVVIDERGGHGATLGYYGGPEDGRMSRSAVLFETELSTIAWAAGVQTDYAVNSYGVHSGDQSLCWVLLMYTPIEERGKL